MRFMVESSTENLSEEGSRLQATWEGGEGRAKSFCILRFVRGLSSTR